MNIWTDIVIPSVIALVTVAGSYWGTRAVETKKQKEEEQGRRTSYLKQLKVTLDQIANLLDKLKEDPSRIKMFSLANVRAFDQYRYKIQDYFNSISLIEDELLRNTIINQLNNLFEVILEIDMLESYSVNKDKENRESAEKAMKELRELRLAMFNLGLYWNKENQLKERKGITLTEEEKASLDQLVGDTLTRPIQTQDELNKLADENKERRLLLVTRILDAKQQIQNLSERINNLGEQK